MDCHIRRDDVIADLVLVGSLDSSWSQYFSDRIDEVVRAGALEVRVDMAGVSYLSSNGIALLIRYHRQMRKIGGRFQIVADSEAVSHVLRLSGVWELLHDDRPSLPTVPKPTVTYKMIERDGLSLQVFSSFSTAVAERLELFGDPARLSGRGYDEQDVRTWRADRQSVALGLGALGPSFDACRGRFGEFLAVAGIAAYRPSTGSGHPDFEQAAGAFVPEVRLLYGLAFKLERAAVIRFEAKGEPGVTSATLSRIAEACLDQSEASGPVGVVLAGETDGLVGAALRRSPVGIPDGQDPFAHPAVRDWLSLTAEPEHARSTALVVGVATRDPSPTLARYVRPLSGARAPQLHGHFHAAVVPYRPLPGGAVELAATVSHLFEPGRVETILHLLGDSRPIVGAGESTFARGVLWYVPLALESEAKLP